MPRYHAPLPSLWLMTDPRMGDGLWPALERLPRGAGVIFRHDGVPGRRAVFDRVRAVARRRGLRLLLAGTPGDMRAWRADGVHGTAAGRVGLRTVSAHDVPEIRRAERLRADLILLSPLFATRSHPGSRCLGRVRFGLLARRSRIPVLALGGVDADTRGLRALGAHGRAGIDAFIPRPSLSPT